MVQYFDLYLNMHNTAQQEVPNSLSYDFIFPFYSEIQVMRPTGMVIIEHTNQVHRQEDPGRKNGIWGLSSGLLHKPSVLYYKGSET